VELGGPGFQTGRTRILGPGVSSKKEEPGKGRHDNHQKCIVSRGKEALVHAREGGSFLQKKKASFERFKKLQKRRSRFHEPGGSTGGQRVVTRVPDRKQQGGMDDQKRGGEEMKNR